MKFREIEKIIQADGWVFKSSKGFHNHYTHPTKTGKVTIPNHSSDLNRNRHAETCKPDKDLRFHGSFIILGPSCDFNMQINLFPDQACPSWRIQASPIAVSRRIISPASCIQKNSAARMMTRVTGSNLLRTRSVRNTMPSCISGST